MQGRRKVEAELRFDATDLRLVAAKATGKT